MELTITLSDNELMFLHKMMSELNTYKEKQTSLEDAVHECIRMAAYEESEEGA